MSKDDTLHVIGISALYHDSACALPRNGEIIAAKSSDKERIEALAQELGLVKPASHPGTGKPPAPSLTSTTDPKPDGRVGIWIPKKSNGKTTYIRDANSQEDFELWARVREIPAKSKKKRIVYIGESAARGFLLDPYYTPAGVLETLLNSQPGLLEAEVVDLALTNASMTNITELCTSGMNLEPDVMVIFAGNNWLGIDRISPDVLDELIEVGEAEGEFEDVLKILEDHYKKRVVSFMAHVNNISLSHRVPVVFIIPGFNLGDYRITLGTRLIYWHNRGTGEYQRKAVDTFIYSGLVVPACSSIIRRILQEEAARYHIPVVDLPEVFKRFQPGKLPGRELFLDYCHLTVKGIQVAMAAAARQLFSTLTKKEIPARELRSYAPAADDDVRGRAHFFGAIHNAHRGNQPVEIIYYHCLQALNASMDVRELMECFVDMATRHTIWALNKSCEKLYENREQKQFPFLLQSQNLYFMDLDLVDAIIAALKKHGINIGEPVSGLRKKEHGFPDGKINLLESYYYMVFYDTFRQFNISYYRAYDVQSRFFLVVEKGSDVVLKLTYRVPGGNLKDGVNEIILQWPPNVKYKPERYPGIEKEMFFLENMYTRYGGIHMFTAYREN